MLGALPDSASHTADISGKAGEDGSQTAGGIGMIPFIRAAQTPLDAGRAAKGVFPGQIRDDLFRYLCHFRRPGRGILPGMFSECCQNRFDFNSVYRKLSFYFRQNPRRLNRSGRIGIFVP
ncbi:MAG: hypothetical protein AAGU02_10075, partial [Lawsonibacter sp.]